MTTLLRTRPLRDHLFAQVKEHVNQLKDEKTPHLAVILVGDNPASKVYVSKKMETAKELGIKADLHHMPKDTTQEELHAMVDKLSNDDSVTALFLQLPLPDHLDEFSAINRIDHKKDVDGLTPHDAGLAAAGSHQDSLKPATPLGCVRILKWAGVELEGAEVVIVGRSILVGRPTGWLLTSENATVTTCHSRTKDLDAHLKRADIVIAAIGKPGFIKGDQLKSDCVAIDVGINAVEDDSERGYHLEGDIDAKSCDNVISMLTPVPGGVGPMTVGSLMTNVIDATYLQLGKPMPQWDLHPAE